MEIKDLNPEFFLLKKKKKKLRASTLIDVKIL